MDVTILELVTQTCEYSKQRSQFCSVLTDARESISYSTDRYKVRSKKKKNEFTWSTSLFPFLLFLVLCFSLRIMAKKVLQILYFSGFAPLSTDWKRRKVHLHIHTIEDLRFVLGIFWNYLEHIKGVGKPKLLGVLSCFTREKR